MKLLNFASLTRGLPSITRQSLCRQRACFHQAANLLKDTKEITEDQPIQYSKSAAFGFQMQRKFSEPPKQDRPDIQAPIICISFAVFLIYFCYLREENDLDKQLNFTLYERIDGLEEQQIRQKIEYNRNHGIDFSALEKRLEEIISEQKK